ncbi:hypothetical protein [Wolbachia endosymbiont (group A) of Andrena trimmerana]|uniref:hypothetical protein n=1 Tax=Wolbachia endosymbiont (group A) of Andrena trimmerana TaxID=3066193 RepID=UPI00333E65AD
MRTSNLGPLIAVLSLSAFSFTAGQYLPYVITAISGSGAIAAVPLAIFADFCCFYGCCIGFSDISY